MDSNTQTGTQNHEGSGGIPAKNGLITGLLISIAILVIYFADRSIFVFSNYFVGIIFGVIIISMLITMLQVREKRYGGKITIAQCVRSAISHLLVTCGIYAVFNFIFYKFIAPGIVSDYLQNVRNVLENSDLNQPDVEQQMKVYTMLFSPLGYCLGSFIIIVILGSIFSMLMAIFVQRH